MSELMALAALTELPNTPLLGVGINFSFNEPEPRADLLKLFNVADSAAIERRGWEVPETGLVRKLTGKDGALNLTLVYDGSAVAIDLNFHTEIGGKTKAANEMACKAVKNRLIKLRDEALGFIGETYHLRLEEGDDDE